MDQSDSRRASGIPRPSRLPVLSKRSSQYLSNTSQQSPVEETPAKHRLSKRSSMSILPRAGKDTTNQGTANRESTSRPGSVIGSRQNGRNPAFKSSVSSVSSRPLAAVPSSWVESDDESSQLRVTSKRDTAIFSPKSSVSKASLSDRAIESIQAVPSTPKDRRQSNFYNVVDSPMAPPPRPTSGFSNSDQANSRPGTSDGSSIKPAVSTAQKVPSTAKHSSRSSIAGLASGKRSTSSSLTKKLQASKATSPSLAAKPFTNGLTEHLVQRRSEEDTRAGATAEKPLSGTGSKRIPSDSSNALRQQIAAAKAAMKKEREKAAKDGFGENSAATTPDTLHADPFNQAPTDEKHILNNRIRTARLDGKLNISALSLKGIPEEVLTMYSSAAIEASKANWSEIVDLTRFIAADNEIEVIDEKVFPDLSQEQLQADESEQETPFGGVEMLDLHGNALTTVPLGLRRLERLTSLNLTHNKLDNAAFEIITKIKTLRDLKLGHNNISGNLSSSIAALGSLEVLDVQSNRLLALPETLRELTHLRILNVSGNQLTALPMQAISHIPLQELDASNNALLASLFPLGGISEHKTLRLLNVSNNSLAALTFAADLELPDLQSIDVTNNHLTILPSVGKWSKLITLRAGDNKIAELPDGFTSLESLKIANFSGNELNMLPPQIALMESLTTLVLASNPLRHKKYLNMAAADIKNDLSALLVGSGHGHHRDPSTDDFDDEASYGTAPEDNCFGHSWTLKPGGVLDLSNRGLTDSVNDTLGSFLKANEVRQLNLRGNKLTTIPPALWLGQDLRALDLSSNPLNADYLTEDLELPSLNDLDLSTCRILLLEPLIDHLKAPKLQTVQLSGNRVSGPVPALRRTYPQLTTLLASDNKFQIVEVDALSGLNTVDLTSNELQSLPAELGLLWDEGLRSFEVGRNAFRVPGHRVLEKGTQALLTWLKHRIKVDQADGEGEV